MIVNVFKSNISVQHDCVSAVTVTSGVAVIQRQMYLTMRQFVYAFLKLQLESLENKENGAQLCSWDREIWCMFVITFMLNPDQDILILW